MDIAYNYHSTVIGAMFNNLAQPGVAGFIGQNKTPVLKHYGPAFGPCGGVVLDNIPLINHPAIFILQACTLFHDVPFVFQNIAKTILFYDFSTSCYFLANVAV